MWCWKQTVYINPWRTPPQTSKIAWLHYITPHYMKAILLVLVLIGAPFMISSAHASPIIHFCNPSVFCHNTSSVTCIGNMTSSACLSNTSHFCNVFHQCVTNNTSFTVHCIKSTAKVCVPNTKTYFYFNTIPALIPAPGGPILFSGLGGGNCTSCNMTG